MNLFDYVRPDSVSEAVAAGSRPDAAYLAGGTNLLDLMKVGVRQPASLVDITRLHELQGLEQLDDGGFRIGALVRNSDLARHADFAAAFPAVAEALLSGASGQLRNAATVSGNLMQQTRCPYFYDTNSSCNRRDPGSGCDAIGGETAELAVLGWTEQCIAVHPSDFCVPLSALEALVEIHGPDGTREAAIDEFYELPTETSPGGAALAPGELITAIRLPAGARRFAHNARYLKVRDRTSYAFALVSASAMLDLDGEKIKDARISLGGVAAKPWRARAAEDALRGKTLAPRTFEKAAEAALADAHPSGENAYKIELARRLVRKSLALAASGTPSRMPALPASVFSRKNEVA